MADDLPSLRAQTLEFISHNPRSIALVRSTIVSDGSGGITRTLTTLSAQSFRLIYQERAGVFRRSIDGSEVQPDYRLVCPYNADIQNGDWWNVDGVKYEVVFVREDQRYEKVAEVIYRG